MTGVQTCALPIYNYLVKIKYPESERNIPTVPIQFDSEPVPDYTPTDKLGSATVAIMRDLGYSDEAIDAALADGSVAGTTSLDDLV